MAERVARLSPVLRALAPRELERRMTALPEAEAALPEEMGGLGALDATLDDALAAVDALEQAAARLRRCPHDVEPFRRPDGPPPWLIEERGQLASRARLTALVQDLAPDADVIRWGDHAYVARFSLRGSPMLLRARFAPPQAGFESYVDPSSAVWVAARTSVPEAMALVTVRRERTTDAVAELLRLRREVEVGAQAFDDAFWVEGDARLATVLAPVFAEGMLALEPHAPELALGRGVAEIRWSTTTDALRLAGPLGVVLGVREAVEAT